MTKQGDQETWQLVDEGQYKAVYILSPDGERFDLCDVVHFARLADRLRAAQAKASEHESLFWLQHKRDMDACMRWRAEDPTGRALTLPDRGNLLDYLWAELLAAEAKATRLEMALREGLWQVRHAVTHEGLFLTPRATERLLEVIDALTSTTPKRSDADE